MLPHWFSFSISWTIQFLGFFCLFVFSTSWYQNKLKKIFFYLFVFTVSLLPSSLFLRLIVCLFVCFLFLGKIQNKQTSRWHSYIPQHDIIFFLFYNFKCLFPLLCNLFWRLLIVLFFFCPRVKKLCDCVVVVVVMVVVVVYDVFSLFFQL